MQTGKQISHYTILEKLGSGGMGTVYKALDLKLDRTVALKFLQKEHLGDPEARKRLINEAKAISRLDHPNIGVVYEINEVDEDVFISMRYFEGKTLREILAEGPLPLEKVYSYGIQIAEGLAEAHRHGIIHRDIKPANIIVTADQQIKILDFGIAKSGDVTAITREDNVVGTVSYMSPEQLTGKAVDVRSDIFVFGAVLYEMTTGQRPFQADYPEAEMYSILNEQPESARALRPDASEALEKTLSKMLQKDKEKRYQQVTEIEQGLRANKPETPVAGQNKSRPYASITKVRMGIFAAGVLALVLITVFFMRERTQNTGATSIAVLPFQIESTGQNEGWLGGAFTELLVTHLNQYDSLRVIVKNKPVPTGNSAGQNISNSDNKELLRIIRGTGVEHVLTGNLSQYSEKITVHARIYRVETGVPLAEIAAIKGEANDLQSLVDNISAKIRPLLNFSDKRDATPMDVASLTTPSLDAYRFYIEGRDAALDNRYDESVRKLQKAIQLDPNFIQPHYYLAWQYDVIGKRDKARNILEKAKSGVTRLSERQRLDYLMMEASIDRRWTDYIAYLERRLQLNPNNASLHYSYGYTQFFYFRRIETSILSLEKTLEIDSSYSQAYKTLAYAHLAKAETETATRKATQYVRINPADISPLSFLADIQNYIGKYQQALQNCEQLYRRQPDFYHALFEQTRAYIGLGQFAQALQTIDLFLDTVHTPILQSDGYTLRAHILLQQGDDKAALVNLQKALLVDPDNAEAHWLSGVIHTRAGNDAEANSHAQELDRVIEQADGLQYMWFRYHLQAEMAKATGDLHSAISGYREALSLYPLDRAFYLTSLGKAHAEMHNSAEAIVALKQALEFNPNFAQAALALAQSYERKNDKNNALYYYREVVRIFRDADPDVQALQIARKKVGALQNKA